MEQQKIGAFLRQLPEYRELVKRYRARAETAET